MMDESAFNILVDEILSQGYDEPAAARFACAIGDTPLKDQDGRIVVMEQGVEIARLGPLSFFSGQF